MKIFTEIIDILKSSLFGSRKAVRDVVLLVIPQGVVLVTGFITSVLVARGLGPAGLGGYALVTSLAGIALTLSDVGIGQTAVRFASRFHSEGNAEGQFSILRWAFRVRMTLIMAVSTMLFFLAPLLADRFWHKPELTEVLRLGLFQGIFAAVASIPNIYFQSMGNFRKNAEVIIVQNVITLGGFGVIALKHLWSIENVVITTIAASFTGALIFLLRLPGGTLLRPGALSGFSLSKAKYLLSNPIRTPESTNKEHDPNTFAMFNVLSSIVVMLTLRADVWLMGYFLDAAQLGVYSAATRFTLPLTVLLSAMTTALWPRAAAQKDLTETVRMLKRTFQICLVLAVLATAYSFVAPMLAPLFFGAQYAKSTLLGQLLSFRYAIAILVAPVGVLGYNFGLVRVYWIINLVQMVVILGINAVFLPQIGPVAAALALIANEVIGFACISVIIWGKMKGTAANPA